MKIVTYVVYTLISCLIFFASFVVFANNKDCKLTVGYDSWEPCHFMDVGNQVRGLDIELLQMVAKRIPCSIAYAQGPWIDLLSRLKTGEIDVLMGASKTNKREQFAYFSTPYRTERFSLYVRKDDTKALALKTFQEFVQSNKKVGVVDDYFYGDDINSFRDGELEEQFVGAIISEINLARLLDENIDAFLEDSIVGASMIRRKGLSSLIVPHGLSITTGDVYFVFSKKSVSPEIVSSFNLSLKKVLESSDYKALLNMYKQ